ncbi:MAG: cob(I)yrinic acid a,c-diamide adenosyltransferase [Eubacteriales bacterium]
MRSAADYVSEIQAVKHPFDTGTAPREGIEF